MIHIPISISPFTSIKMAKNDPILGVTENFNADKNFNKINLGVGVYCDSNGKIPLLECVQKAKTKIASILAPYTYLPIDGLASYNKEVQKLIFGIDNIILKEKRVITIQALGGTGALKLGADFIKKFLPDSTQIWISNPSWENHYALFKMAGFVINQYPYYNFITHNISYDIMLNTLKSISRGSVIVLHACCHNPTGTDLNFNQWKEVINVIISRGLIPFIDMAYQGFGDGIQEDMKIIRLFSETNSPIFISNSFSKSFSLYGERVGALSVVTANENEAKHVLSQLKRIVRTNYSNPPSHGAQIVTTILNLPELRELWEKELTLMRLRINEMRRLLVNKLKEKVPSHNFEFILKQRGIFSYSGLTKVQVKRLQNEFSIYAIDTGRICIAALNDKNINTVVDAIVTIL